MVTDSTTILNKTRAPSAALPYRHLFILSLIIALWPLTCFAEPALDFTPDNGATFKTTDLCEQSCSTGGQTRFASVGQDMLEIVDIGGVSYLHQIMGDPADGFVQEIYVKQENTKTWYSNPFISLLITGPTGAYSGAMGSVSSQDWSGGNSEDPLNLNPGIVTGNGSANPQKVIMRQIVSSNGMVSEFIKDKLDRKPMSTLLLSAPGITSTTVIDMRNSGYSDMNIAGVVSNTMSLSGEDVPLEGVAFNMATDSENSIIDAGRYTWTSGAGPGGAGGTYEYLNGTTVTSADMEAIVWDTHWDPFEENPWSQIDHPASRGCPTCINNRPTP